MLRKKSASPDLTSSQKRELLTAKSTIPEGGVAIQAALTKVKEDTVIMNGEVERSEETHLNVRLWTRTEYLCVSLCELICST